MLPTQASLQGATILGQRFHPGDIGTIGVLVVLEALLSADNALVLAIMVRHLPLKERNKALLYGLGGAFVLRTMAILLAASIIKFWWLQAIGAIYLLYLPTKHFISTAQGQDEKEGKHRSFWATVVYLNLVDLAFALDSVVAAVAVVDTVHHHDKLWVVVAGAIIGIVLLRFAASFFIRLLEKFPVLDHVAYVLVGWAGLKLLLISGHSFEEWYGKNYNEHFSIMIPEMPAWLFWGGMAVIAIGGALIAMRHPASKIVHEEEACEIEEVIPHQFHPHERHPDAKPADAPSTDKP
jgi:YkoY family integral membrane protein